MRNPVKCNFWRRVKNKEDCCCGCEGVCTAGVVDNPTISFCNTTCPANTSKPDHYFVSGIDYTKKPSILQKIYAYLKAESSMIIAGRLNDRIFKQRMNTCRTCEHLVQSDDEVGHCGVCGCGMNRRAALTVKGRMPSAECVKGKWKK